MDVSLQRNFIIFFEFTFSDKYEIYRYFNTAISTGHFSGITHKRVSENILKEIKRLGIHRFLKTTKYILMDSGGFQYLLNGKPTMSQKEVFEIQMACRPDYASTLDFPTDSSERTGGIIYDGKRQELTRKEKDERVELTIENAGIFLDLFLKKNPSFIPIGVIQGYDEKSYKYCAFQLKKMDFPYYGVGSCFRAPKFEVLRRVKWVREVIPDKPLHVFGIGSISLMQALWKEFNVSSVDTASHIVAASYGNVFVDGKQKWGRKISGLLGELARKRGNKSKYRLALYNAGQIEYYVIGKPNIFSIVNYTKG